MSQTYKPDSSYACVMFTEFSLYEETYYEIMFLLTVFKFVDCHLKI